MHTEQAPTPEHRTDVPDARRAVFEASGVTVRFGGLLALHDVTLAVEPGQVHGVIGPNGAGKTTLFNVCCGFLRPDSGSLRRHGRDVPFPRPHQLAGMGIARTLQGVGLFRGLTVVENVMIGADIYRRSGFASALLALPRAAADERRLRANAMRALDRLGVADYAERPPPALPYPIQKRVAIARALALAPSLLLLDEPASGLGHDDIAELGELVGGLTGDMSVAVVDHHMDFVMSICDRITVLNFGEVIATGTPTQVKRDPEVLRAYLGDPDSEAPQSDAPESEQHD